ncbi:unnamed protein product, partial [Rotaria sordida]
MSIHTHLEDLSNEIFFEIFDYLHALDILTGFTSLNQRISSILQSIPFRIIIPHNYCRRQIDFLSYYLTFHAHQVISLEIHDIILDYSSVINLLFNRHNFINLQSCIFTSINSSTKFENVFKQIQSLNRLVRFSLLDPYFNLNEKDKCVLTRMMLMHKSSSLHSIILDHCYDYLDISNYTSISSNLTSLHLRLYCTSSTVILYLVLSIFRVCHGIQHLGLRIEQKYSVENNNVNVPSLKLSLNDKDYPILSKLVSFNLIVCIICDIYSIAYILRCMPNLNRFNFLLATRMKTLHYYRKLFNGYVWEQIVKHYVPCLSNFEFHMSIWKSYSKLNLDFIVNSFQYFVRKYSNWNMIIDRWNLVSETPEEFVMLRTFNYCKNKSSVKILIPYINSGSYETLSTTTIKDHHHLFYSDIGDLRVFFTKTTSNITWSSPLYTKVNYLFIQMGIILYSSLWNRLLNTVISHETTDDEAQQHVTYLSCLVDLSNITELEFSSKYRIYQWKSIQLIL